MGSGVESGWVEFAVVGRAHGVRGDVYVRPANPDSDLLATRPRVRRDSPSGDELRVERARSTPKGWIVAFAGVGERDAASALTNCKLFIERSAFPPEEDDEVYQADLIGARVRTAPEGPDWGVVKGFFFNGAHDVCVLRVGGDDVMIPFHDDILVDFDLESGWILVELPDGIPGLEALP